MMIAAVQQKKLHLTSPNSRRDFIFIHDVISALLNVTKIPKINGEIFNIGCGKEYSIEEIVNLVQKIINHDLKISYDNNRQGEFDKSGGKGFANLEKTKKILHWKPTYSIKHGLSKTYDWYKKHIELYE
jgi:dTDP-glucose 4,6-dehydratase